MIDHMLGVQACVVPDMTLVGLAMCKWFQTFGRLMSAFVYARRFSQLLSPPSLAVRREVCGSEFVQVSFGSLSGIAVSGLRALEVTRLRFLHPRDAVLQVPGWDEERQRSRCILKVLLHWDVDGLERIPSVEAVLTGRVHWVEIDFDFPEWFFPVKFGVVMGMFEAWLEDGREKKEE